jgi:DnaJ-class molecular chaperone
LTGVTFTLKHLDGTSHTINTIKNDVIAHKEKKTVRGLGMPFFKDNMNFGNLIIEFSIVMPKKGELKP